jgi:hypothetical protein
MSRAVLGEMPHCYYLTREGYHLLKRHRALPYKFRNRNTMVGNTITHDLYTQTFLTKLRATYHVTESIDLPDTYGRWTIEVRPHGMLYVVPDTVIEIEGDLFFIETDMSTEPTRRRDVKRSSIFKKIIQYQASKELFKPYRVIFNVKNEKRVRDIIQAVHEFAPNNKGMFLFTHNHDTFIDGRGDLTEL